MTGKCLALSMILIFAGCQNDKANEHFLDGVTVTDIKGDRPAFKREYRAQLSNGRSLLVTIKTSYGGDRYKSGELDQPGDKWVMFDPDAVADKIIDPILVPVVQKYCDQINAIDKQFRDSNPQEFVDEGGTHWRRQP